MNTVIHSFTHQVQFGNIAYDAIKTSENEYILFANYSKAGTITDNGIAWILHHSGKVQSKPYHKVIIIPFGS